MSLVSRYLDPTLVERLNHLQLSARSVVEGSTIGLHRSPVKGASIEFRQHRFYVPGDDPRRLDWRVLARTDRPAFCFQGHPEASPGPHEMGYLFDRFVALMARA